MPGMWYEIEGMFKSSGIDIGSSAHLHPLPVSQLKTHPRFTPPSPPCHSVVTPTEKSASFYVGDSAGRRGDFSATASDRKFALNVGVDFHTPEVSSPSHVSFELRVLIQVHDHRNIFLANRLQSTRSQGFIRLPFQLGVRARSLPEHLWMSH